MFIVISINNFVHSSSSIEECYCLSVPAVNVMDMKESTSTCNEPNCPLHFHVDDSMLAKKGPKEVANSEQRDHNTEGPDGHASEPTDSPKFGAEEEGNGSSVKHGFRQREKGFNRIIRNFTPS